MNLQRGRSAGRAALAALVMAGAAACGGGDVEFEALDAEGIASVVDDALTEESGLKGLISASDFASEEVDEFNVLAKDACDDLSDGISGEEYDEFEAGVLDGATGLEEMIDTVAMVQSLVGKACPSYLGNLNDAING